MSEANEAAAPEGTDTIQPQNGLLQDQNEPPSGALLNPEGTPVNPSNPVNATPVSENPVTVNVDMIESDEEDETSMSLPLSKIKRILKMDPEYFGSSATAVYATGAATELFVQYLVEQASMNAKIDKRKKIQYKDLSSAVSSQEALYFLNDTIPKTQIVREALKEKKINLTEEDKKKYDPPEVGSGAQDMEVAGVPEQQLAEVRGSALPKGQTTLPFASTKKINKAGISNLMDNDAMQID